MHSDHDICFKVELQIVIHLFWNWKKKGEEWCRGLTTYSYVAPASIFYSMTQMYLCIWMVWLLCLLYWRKPLASNIFFTCCRHPPTHQAAGAIAGGELGICLSPARSIMGVQQYVVAMANDLAPFSHFSPLLPLLHNTKVCTNLPISCTKWSLTSWTQRVGTKGLLWKVIWNDFWFGKQCTNSYCQKCPY